MILEYSVAEWYLSFAAEDVRAGRWDYLFYRAHRCIFWV